MAVRVLDVVFVAPFLGLFFSSLSWIDGGLDSDLQAWCFSMSLYGSYICEEDEGETIGS